MMRSASTLSASGIVSASVRAAPDRFHDGCRLELQAVAGEGKAFDAAARQWQPAHDP